MPIYAYRCESCGHAMDVLRKVSDPVLTTCPACGAEALRKQVTAAGFQLKGSGWYVTDFKGESKSPAADAKSAGQSASANGGDAKPSQAAAPAQVGAKAETKPAPAPAAASGAPATGKAPASGSPSKPGQ
ncbi:MAG TPA: zinc ribbon domain-containing protein [Burkholderiaceae bacterium]|jgi:putative FmdB family regulatory protein|nr:zinc ribbon domain-containing protein [Burkholderiaceae bacterium]